MMNTRETTTSIRRSTIDEQLARLVGQHAVRNVDEAGFDVIEDLVRPAGMTVEDERELSVLMQLADPGKDGDEAAAIDRLVTALDRARQSTR